MAEKKITVTDLLRIYQKIQNIRKKLISEGVLTASATTEETIAHIRSQMPI